MSENIRSIDIKMEVDTNKRTIVRHGQPESIEEAVAFLYRMAEELNEEVDLSEGLHKIRCGYPYDHDPHRWIAVRENHSSRYYCLGRN